MGDVLPCGLTHYGAPIKPPNTVYRRSSNLHLSLFGGGQFHEKDPHSQTNPHDCRPLKVIGEHEMDPQQNTFSYF